MEASRRLERNTHALDSGFGCGFVALEVGESSGVRWPVRRGSHHVALEQLLMEQCEHFTAATTSTTARGHAHVGDENRQQHEDGEEEPLMMEDGGCGNGRVNRCDIGGIMHSGDDAWMRRDDERAFAARVEVIRARFVREEEVTRGLMWQRHAITCAERCVKLGPALRPVCGQITGGHGGEAGERRDREARSAEVGGRTAEPEQAKTGVRGSELQQEHRAYGATVSDRSHVTCL